MPNPEMLDARPQTLNQSTPDLLVCAPGENINIADETVIVGASQETSKVGENGTVNNQFIKFCASNEPAKISERDASDNSLNMNEQEDLVRMDDAWFDDKGFKMLFLNVHHLIPKCDDIKYQLMTHMPHIFGMCETFLNVNIDDKLLCQNGYVFERKDRSEKMGGGVLCYVREDVVYKRRTDLEGSLEIICLEIINKSSKNITVGFVYRPPDMRTDWLDHFADVLESAMLEKNELIIMGDFNVDILKGNNSAENTDSKLRKLEQITKSANLCQVINSPTRVTNLTSTLIDHAYVSNPENIANVVVPSCGISDHFPICITRKSNGFKNGIHKEISYRCMKHFNEALFLKDLSNASWDLESCKSVDDLLTTWYDTFTTILNKHAPVRTKRVKRYKQPDWMNQEVIESMRKRDFYKKANDHQNYKFWRNRTKSIIRASKKSFYAKVIQTRQNNSKDLWRHIKEACPDKCTSLPTVLQANGVEETETSKLVELLNVHYGTISDKYLTNKHKILDSKYADIVSHFVNSRGTIPKFAIPSITEDFVLKQLKCLTKGKACGLDGISAAILKISAQIIAPSITKICNISIETGIFPAKWKEARIAPIYKGGPKEECCSYRPVSILPIISKVIERHVFVHLYDHMNDNGLLLDTQYGFRKNHSCQTALICLIDTIYQAIYEGKSVGSVQLDLSKAFDLINHSLLLQKLKIYCCDEPALIWFNSYLCNRTHIVKLRNCSSDSYAVTSGVPQGSIIGPLMFLIFLNDLPLHIINSTEIMYADDATLIFAHDDIDVLETKLTEDVKIVSEWCFYNDMALSIKKSNAMLLSTRQKHLKAKLDIMIDDCHIPFVETCRVLGLHFDCYLKWNKQVKNVCNKIVKGLYLLKRIKAYLPTEMRKLFYNAYVLPHFDYCCIIWGTCDQKLMFELSKLQKRAARLILDVPFRTPSKVMFGELNWIPLKLRIEYHIAVQMYQCIHGMCPSKLENYFQLKNDRYGYKTRSAANNDLYISKGHVKSFIYRGAKVWNSIPAKVRNASSLSSFKTLCRNHYFDMYR